MQLLGLFASVDFTTTSESAIDEAFDFDAQPALTRLHAMLDELGVKFVPPSIATERGSGPIAFTAALIVPDIAALVDH